METKYLLKMDNISKEYFGNKVLKGVQLHVAPGEIHALMGENGAGKSTLMNILFGMPVIHSTGGFEGTSCLVSLSQSPVQNSRRLTSSRLLGHTYHCHQDQLHNLCKIKFCAK